MEDRIRRHQKIMRSRYSKFLRRRSLWEDHDCTHRHGRLSDHLGSRRYCGQKPSQVTNSQKAKPAPEVQDRYGFDKDFEAFRAAIDRAIARDPYGTLFGRRMARHPWITNPAWTPLSWLSQRENLAEHEGVQPSKPKPAENGKASPEEQHTATLRPSKPSQGEETTTSFDEQDYQYDPISMRKVPIKKPDATAETAPEEKKPLLETLFSEHGVDIPIKTYKPHKVHGYGAPTQESEDYSPEVRQPNFHRSFDSSKKQEIRDLLARSKGNSLDTTARFTEAGSEMKAKESPEKPIVSEDASEPLEPDESAPLFSGTTYADRFNNEASNPIEATPSENAERHAASEDQRNITESTVEINVKESSSRLEPALNRIQAEPVKKTEEGHFTLQTAVDRHVSKSKKEIQKAGADTDTPKSLKIPAATTEEDIDLLRASDVRAAVRSARVTKQETDTLKNETRATLEADFAARQSGKAAVDGEGNDDMTSTLTKKINHVWDHVRDYPQGIVAKTMQSVNAFNENYKKYVRPDGIKGLTDKLVFQDETLSRSPSIYKDVKQQQTLDQFTPSKEVLEAERERSERTANLKRATVKAKEEAETRNVQLSQLANNIRAAYEHEYGPIDVHHRQPDATTAEAEHTGPAPPSKPHPLTTASVKPGVTTNPVIDQHVSEFEPRFAELVDGAKEIRTQLWQADEELQQVRPSLSSSPDLSTVIDGMKEIRRELHEAHLALRAIESGRPETVWNAPHRACSNFGQKRVDWKAEGVSANDEHESAANEKNSVEPMEGQVSSMSEPPTKEPKKVPKKVPEPFITPDGSPAWNDEQPPSIEDLRKIKFDSQFIILAFDPSTGKVEFSPMNAPTRASPKPADAVGILGKLKNAPEFLKHFATMKRAGYSLFNGNENMLIFKKKQPEQASVVSGAKAVEESKTTIVIASSTSVSGKTNAGEESTISMATVLEDVPAEAEPTAGPAAPTAPPSRTYGNLGQTKVKRQEDVFSGTIRPNAASQAGGNDSSPPEPRVNPSNEHGGGLWKRFTRSLKRTAMIVAALTGTAYVIGFVAEGMGAETQKQNGVEDSQAQGPRKRIVMTGQRPGIYSTESSR
ncbi:hypothetical protein A1O1_03602 [Capronia coronata CBS 617.96]|uniref:Uncharacterized protein n=1 Tax=Capronia coronata CBS 617.96 TaxID=1182541 RepID=W9Z7L5_9EURO|nr:uncharacterized protein A1O1_03602 [Capronia coronata CBS 617.96]EXJ90499.1 hypothetical protein A1O1_03602 [Capronia coronata CBS 617.96]